MGYYSYKGMFGGGFIMNEVNATCLMCGKTYLVGEDHKDYNKLASNISTTYICDKCNHKVRYETEEQNKPIKPM